jgi:hypothetical protein
VAVPILSAVVILVEELRVKPIDRAAEPGQEPRLAPVSTVATASPPASR